MLEILEFVFSSPFKFIGSLLLLLLILAIIEEVVVNICNCIVNCRKLKALEKVNTDKIVITDSES